MVGMRASLFRAFQWLDTFGEVEDLHLRVIRLDVVHPRQFEPDCSDSQICLALPYAHHLPRCRVIRLRTLPLRDYAMNRKTVARDSLGEITLGLDRNTYDLFFLLLADTRGKKQKQPHQRYSYFRASSQKPQINYTFYHILYGRRPRIA